MGGLGGRGTPPAPAEGFPFPPNMPVMMSTRPSRGRGGHGGMGPVRGRAGHGEQHTGRGQLAHGDKEGAQLLVFGQQAAERGEGFLRRAAQEGVVPQGQAKGPVRADVHEGRFAHKDSTDADEGARAVRGGQV